MTHHNRITTVFFALALFSLSLQPPSVEAKDSPKNQRLLAAFEPFEELTEIALSGDAKKIDAALKSAQKDRKATRALLSDSSAVTYDKAFSALEAAQMKHDNIGVSLQSVELYKLLVSSLDPSALAVPIEVGLLDYSGMRTNALLKATPPDWTALAATAREADSWWANVSARVTNRKLNGEMSGALKGLADAAKARDSNLSRSSSKRVLDLVDELESFFSR